MTDKLRAAAEMVVEALVNASDALRDGDDAGCRWILYEQIHALRQALDQLPDTTKMIEPSISIVGWMYEDQLPEIYPYEEMFPFSVALDASGVRMFPVYAPKAEPDMGIDRGAWADVPDATKWVDDLRGDEDLEEPPNSTTDVVEPVAWIVPDYGFLFPNEDSAQRYLDNIESNAAPTPLYTAPPKREWQGLTDDEITEAGKSTVEGKYMLPHSFARAIEAKLKEKNGG